jgi:Fic family protein
VNIHLSRPTDPMTAQDGAQILAKVQSLSDTVSQFSNQIALLQRNEITMLELLAKIDSGLSETRVGRLEAELRETELERDLAEQHLRAVEERLTIKKNVSDQAVDTNEKIRAAAATMYADLEQQKKKGEADYWLDIRRSITKTVLITLSVGGVSAVLGFVWWLIQLYVNRAP